MTPEQKKALALAAARRRRNAQSPESDTGADDDFSFAEMVKNIPSSGLQFGKDIVTPVMHPVDTAKSVYNLLQGVVQKAIPGDQDEEVYADQVGQFIKDRYGSWDNLKQTIESDPVGFLADASGLLAGLGAVGKVGKVGKIGKMLQETGKAIDPVNLGINTTKYGVGKMIPERLPQSMYESAAKFSTTLTPDQRKSLTATALRERVMPTRSGLAKLDLGIKELGQKIDDLVQSATDSGVTIPKEKIYQHLDELRADVGGAKLNAPQDLRKIQRITDAFDEHLRNTGKDALTPSELQAFKQDAYRRINWDAKQGQANYVKEQTGKAMARAAKDEIEKVSPDVQALNRRQGDLLELRPYLERSAGRIENRDVMGIGMPMKATAGGVAAGPVGAAAGTGLAIFDIPQVKARGAITAEALRNTGVDQFVNNATLPYLLRQGALQSGRLKQSQDKIPELLRLR